MAQPNDTPLFKQIEANLKPLFSKRIPKNVFGKSPSSVFIGKFNYPNVYAGPMVGITDNIKNSDAPGKWYGLKLEEIVAHRLSLARGEATVSVKNADSRMARDLQDTALSLKAIDMEVNFEREPIQKINFSQYLSPMGAAGKMEKFTLADNPTIPKKVLSLVEEKLKVTTAVYEGFQFLGDTYYLQRVLSSGALGEEKKLVPTRWSITAADDIITKQLLGDVREFRALNEITVYSNKWMGNHFEIVFLPGMWEYEQFESWEPGSYWAQKSNANAYGVATSDPLEYEYEPFEGRTAYAEREGGGYYAGRIACVEHLHKLKRQARVIVLREISDEYQVAVGVWQVRQNCREALKNEPKKFQNRSELLNYLQTALKRPLSQYTSKSRVLTQRKLVDF
ncbi:MAG: hypothetical protein V1722_02725 [Candidatus Micrarchaeota archaeon]